MKKIRWVKISVTALLAAQSACSYDDKAEVAQIKPTIETPITEKFTKLDLKKLPKAVQGRMRCACQQSTGHE